MYSFKGKTHKRRRRHKASVYMTSALPLSNKHWLSFCPLWALHMASIPINPLPLVWRKTVQVSTVFKTHILTDYRPEARRVGYTMDPKPDLKPDIFQGSDFQRTLRYMGQHAMGSELLQWFWLSWSRERCWSLMAILLSSNSTRFLFHSKVKSKTFPSVYVIE